MPGCGHGVAGKQPLLFGIVAEHLAVAAPMQGGIELALYLVIGKVLVENIAK